MTDWTRNKKFMSWSFTKTSRMYQELWDYGYKIYQMGCFEFQVDETGTITGSIPTELLQRINRWPHIRWLLTVRNDGYESIFQALLDNTGGAQDTFISEIHRILDTYSSWAAGIDIDLERGGGEENRQKAVSLFQRIYNEVKGRASNTYVHVDLPAMTGPGESVGGEYWCDYAALEPYFDSCTIMSYGMAWAGSAPGPISPTWWMEAVYNYAVTVIPPEKIYMGLPVYAFRWQIYDYPENLGQTYRGTGMTYLAALYWLQGKYNHTGDQPPQPFIPFAGFYDWENMCPYILLHVYDYLTGHDYSTRTYPMVTDSYGDKDFITCYSKIQRKTSTGVIAEKSGNDYDLIEGAMTDGDGYVSPREPQEIVVGYDPGTGDPIYGLEDPGHAVYTFSVPSDGNYDILVRVNFPWWDMNAIDIALDGSRQTMTETELWYPYWRQVHWKWYQQSVYLTAGEHTIEVWGDGGSVYGTQFWGFEVSTNGGHEYYPGEAEFIIEPHQFKDVNGSMVGPASTFKLTLEVLRRDSDYALIWYEDFRDYGQAGELPSYYTINSGSWSVYYDPEDTRPRPYSWVEGYGDFSLDYSQFSDVHIRARITFPTGSSGKAGIYLGDLYLALNKDTQQLELYEGGSLVGSCAMEILEERQYQIALRQRGSSVKVYSGYADTLRFSVTVTSQTGKIGIRSDDTIQSDLIRIGDAWWYEPYEAIALQKPNGEVQEFGRLSRTGVTWNTSFQMFRVNSDIEEPDTRTESINKEWDYLHSDEFSLTMGSEYTIKIIGRDLSVWTSMIYLGDADGFSILYYEDVDHYVHFANRAAYDWSLAGTAIWALGQEDPILWNYLPEVIPNPYE